MFHFRQKSLKYTELIRFGNVMLSTKTKFVRKTSFDTSLFSQLQPSEESCACHKYTYIFDRPKKCACCIFFTDLCFWWSDKYFYWKVGKLNVLCKYLVDTKFVTYTVLGTCFYFAKKSDTCNYVMDDVFSLRRTCQCLFPLIHWTKPVDSVSCSCNEVCPIYYNIM